MKSKRPTDAVPPVARFDPSARARASSFIILLPAAILLLARPAPAQQVPGETAAADTVTLSDALQRARSANARLPISATTVSIGEARLEREQGRVWPSIRLDGDVRDGVPSSYAAGEARLQAIAADTLVDSGLRRAAARSARFHVTSARAGYRMAVRDVELQVRIRYAEALRERAEVQVRQKGIERLKSYLTFLKAQRAGGEGNAADILKTRTRIANQLASSSDAERLLDQAEVELNTLMGRDPRAPLTVVPLPEPSHVPGSGDEPWLSTPDVAAAVADTAAASAEVERTRAEWRPHLWLSLDVGWEPAFQPSPMALMNNGRGAGAEVIVGFTWPLWRHGVQQAQIAEARLRARRFRQSLTVVQRQAHLHWARAAEELQDIYRVYRLRAANVPVALDSYLEAEAMYRRGSATALDVLDAFTSWMDAELSRAQAILDYRIAKARLTRWGES